MLDCVLDCVMLLASETVDYVRMRSCFSECFMCAQAIPLRWMDHFRPSLGDKRLLSQGGFLGSVISVEPDRVSPVVSKVSKVCYPV